MKKILVSAVLILSVIINAGFTIVYADPASDKAKINEIQVQRNDLENKIEIMDNQIETIMFEINDNKNNIAYKQNDIKQAQINVLNAESDIKAEQEIFGKRIRAMYMSGSSNYADTILGSKDIDDFISRLSNLKRIINYDQNIFNDLKMKKIAIDIKKLAVDTENTKLISLKLDNEKKLTDLTKQKSVQSAFVTELKVQESKYGAKLIADQAIEDASKIAIMKIKNSAPVIASKNTDVISSNSVLSYASNYIGVPYLWGGTSPSGFDCSGFTKYVFAHFGVNLPRLSQAQQDVGTLVPRANLQPGDLVFFGMPAHHVGIYVGNGDMINAPHTGAVVRIQTLNSDFTYGRRVN